MKQDYIYSDIINDLLFSINKALLECIRIGHRSEYLVPENPNLIDCFNDLEKGKIDKHITAGLFDSHQDRGDRIYPRILKIVINAFLEASEVKNISRFSIPSPLYILYHTLINPEHPQTAAYSLASTRTYLFNLLTEKYNHDKKEKLNGFISGIAEQEVMSSIDSFIRHIRIQARWPKSFIVNSRKSYVNLLVGHFMALKGAAHLSFDTKADAKKFLKFNNIKDLKNNISSKFTTPKFRISNKFNELPEVGEIINQLYGVPIPIKGAETVFFGGLKPSASGGLVIGLSGQAGIGKTSLALALANSLSPLGINCFYLSTEEDSKDISKRLYSLQTSFEKELSYYISPEKWFFSTNINYSISPDELITIIEQIKNSVLSEKELNKPTEYCKAVIVLDNLNDFSNEDKIQKIKEIVEKFRNLKSIVILIGAESVLEMLKMDYLIDIGIKLTHEGIDQNGEKPLRLFNLYKTRHQLSRQGTHIFHMSGEEGFRISPQIPSQMDRKEKVKRYLHNEQKIIHTLNYINDDGKTQIVIPKIKTNKNPYFKLYPRTHILVHGYGSAGKAGFSLKLLLTPPILSGVSTRDIFKIKFGNSINRRKVLIISFLYPEQYYRELIFEKGQIQRTITAMYNDLQDPIIDYLIFYPGYISPEDFINKITRKLDQGILEGQQFSGVLIDGLHNVFLQFIRLQQNHMVWPLLYNILARYDVTVVSTFTNFAMNDRLFDDDQNSKNKIINQALPDHMLLQQGMAPFLHALVKASDYYFFLEQLLLRNGDRKYLLAIKGAIGQNVPTELFEWDRQRNVFTSVLSYKSIQKLLEN